MAQMNLKIKEKDKPHSKTLYDHRRDLAETKNAYTYEIFENPDRLIKNLQSHLKNYQKDLQNLSISSLKKIIILIFNTQEQRPIFHVEGTELPLCWNRPQDWDKNYIKYEWGHLRSKNQAKSLDTISNIENLALYSSRCNQQIQSSMNIEELMIYGGILAQRICNVLTKRRELFSSEEWKEVLGSTGSG